MTSRSLLISANPLSETVKNPVHVLRGRHALSRVRVGGSEPRRFFHCLFPFVRSIDRWSRFDRSAGSVSRYP